MILYHGTSSKFLDKIKCSGLKPRGKRKGNWEGSIKSKSSFVYLTSAYPAYFAAIAAQRNGGDLLLVKCNVDETKLYPDEDYVAKGLQTHHEDYKDIPLGEINPLVNLRHYKQLWEASLKYNGVVAHLGTINAERIVDTITIPFGDVRMLKCGVDASPIPMNYMILGQHYNKIVELLFEYRGDESVYPKVDELWRSMWMPHQEKLQEVKQCL